MKSILYIVILLSLIAIPAERSDVGDLLPVEVISVSKHSWGVEIRTDTGNAGIGENLEAAYWNLRETCSADIYLDTADYLILTGEAQELTGELRQYLKDGVRVCAGKGEIDTAEVAAYLSVHVPVNRLKDIDAGTQLQVLTQTQAGFRLE